MQNDFFQTVANRRADAIAKLDADTFAPLIRNHLLQLFRAAHAKDKGLTGVLAAMGRAVPTGVFAAHDGDESSRDEASNWEPTTNWQPNSPEVYAFLRAVHDYDSLLCNGGSNDLPYIADITPADLITTRAKKAAIHGPRGSRSRA